MRFMIAMSFSLFLLALVFLLISLLGFARDYYLLGKWFWIFYGYKLKVPILLTDSLMIYLLVEKKRVKNCYVFLVRKMCGNLLQKREAVPNSPTTTENAESIQ